MPKKVSIGIVTSDKNSKTRRVEIPRLVRHPRYGKYLRQKTVCYVHDENDASNLGDTVEIIEGRRRSKTKRWELVRVLEKNTAVDLAAMQAQSAIEASEIPAAMHDSVKTAPEDTEPPAEIVTEAEGHEQDEENRDDAAEESEQL